MYHLSPCRATGNSTGLAHSQAQPQVQAISQSTVPCRSSTRSLNGIFPSAPSCVSTPTSAVYRRLPTLMLTAHSCGPSVVASYRKLSSPTYPDPDPGPGPLVTCVHSFTSSLTGTPRTTSKSVYSILSGRFCGRSRRRRSLRRVGDHFRNGMNFDLLADLASRSSGRVDAAARFGGVCVETVTVLGDRDG